MRSIITLFLAAIGFNCCAQGNAKPLISNQDDNSLLWEVTGKGLTKPSYVFGTFHIMCKDDIILSDQLKTAISSSDKVYFELDMDDMSVMLGGLLLMNMKDGKELRDFYTDAEYDKIELFFKDSVGMPFALFKKAKPFFLTALIYPKMMACDKTSGVEEELMKIAKLNGKEIKGLETMEQQAAVFDSIPYDVQAKELLRSIDSINEYKLLMDTMVNVYKTQQLDEIAKVLNRAEFGMEDNQDVLLYDRNKNWVIQLNDIMKKESVFVAVGAGHLVGEKGVINLLKKEGYIVRPILNK